MRGAAVPPGILDHIRHAEAWLRHARADWARGDARQVLLRLLLAEAEIRRARESGTFVDAGVPVHRQRPVWMVWGAIAAAALLVVAGYALIRSLVSAPTASAPPAVQAVSAVHGGTGILRFESGRVLPFVGFPGGTRLDRMAPGGFWGPDTPLGGESFDSPLRFGDDGIVPAISK